MEKLRDKPILGELQDMSTYVERDMVVYVEESLPHIKRDKPIVEQLRAITGLLDQLLDIIVVEQLRELL